jgi:hypothetical protein
MWGTFFNLKHVYNNSFHGHDLNGKWSRLKEEKGVGRLFLNLYKLCKKMFLDIFKRFSPIFRDATAPYFYPVGKNWCHQSVEKIFLQDPTLNISKITCIICSLTYF